MLRLLLILLLVVCSCSTGGVTSEDSFSPGPIIRSVSTAFDGKAVCGKPVVIEGLNFSPKAIDNKILFGAGTDVDEVQPTEVSETRLVFDAPEIEAESIQIRVVSKGKESSAYTLNYDELRCDSVKICRNATVRELRKGVTWINIYDEWEGSIRSINVVRIEPYEIENLAIACPKSSTKTSTQCLEHGAFLGINGSYFSHTYVKVDGKVIKEGKDDGIDPFMHDGVFTLDGNVPGIRYVGTNFVASSLTNRNIMCCGPLLISDNEQRTMVEHSHNTTTHPRTGVAITEHGCVLLVTVDGRFTGKAEGMPTPLFARLLDVFGAEYALNLDGGGSTTMWIEGYGIVNHPCDERQWDDPVERTIGSIIYLK